MNELKTFVQWTRIGLLALFVIAVGIELSFGILLSYYEFEPPFLIQENERLWFNVAGGIIILLEVVAGWILYRRKIKYIQILDRLEEKLKIFGRIYSIQLLLVSKGGVTALLIFGITQDILWYFPWLICMYVIGKNFPFNLNLFHAMGIEEEEERKLFYKE
ncbi:hypothetical protein DF185_01655 [Marinifilum breve]|uniref:Uncharacterized protein n=1 Tax=Marinifilum breve TaxID=2184082 RepID=A0A2V4A2D5_9BACT|nr:hypothetical protein [Marinifilum breve]PXY02822.1 hypothetical protein DF185_01655 [Marinifilum breve]